MKRHFPKAFTLIELLVVMAILATIATTVILVINPAELLKEARDSNRLSDLAALNSALSLFQTDQYNLSLGTASTTYVSVPDSSPTCANLGLPALPSGWSYACVSSASSTRVDGTGWIPVNFSLISSGSPLSKLPIDPINTTSTGQYYTYTPGGSWELTALPESQKQKTSLKNTPAVLNVPGVYAVGSNLTLSPLFNTNGLVGYWPLDGSANDASGNNNNGTWSGTQTNGSYYTGGKIGQAGNFNGTDDYVNVSSIDAFISGSQGSVSVWVYPQYTSTSTTGYIFSSWGPSSNRFYLTYYPSSGSVGASRGNPQTSIGLGNTSLNNWYYLALTWNSSTMYGYSNGNLISSSSYTNSSSQGGNSTIGAYQISPAQLFPGEIDDVRIYNRALSAAEIQAIYNATK